jgi:hypothetical protein
MLYCIIELRETFWVIVEQLSMCIGNGSVVRQTAEEDCCIDKLVCKRIRRVPSDDLDEEFIKKMNR